MKKPLITFLTLSSILLTAPTTILAKSKRGTESGGGGDAIVQNGKLVMRDFVIDNEELLEIENNMSFLLQYPEVKEVIMKIGSQHPRFAASIIKELMKVKYLLTDKELSVLAPQSTSLSGINAEIQIAIRYEDDVIISKPAFDKLENKAFILIHEALHGLLDSNRGPAHHARIRKIVKYLENNLESIDFNEFDKLLKDNKFNEIQDRPYSRYVIETPFSFSSYSNALFDEETSLNLRCAQADSIAHNFPSKSGYQSFTVKYENSIDLPRLELTNQLTEFVGVDCKNFKAPFLENHPKYSLNLKYGVLYSLSVDVSSLKEKTATKEESILIESERRGLFAKKSITAESNWECNVNANKLSEYNALLSTGKRYLEFYKSFNKIKTNTPSEEKFLNIFKNFQENYEKKETLQDYVNYFLDNQEKFEQRLELLNDNHKKCQEAGFRKR